MANSKIFPKTSWAKKTQNIEPLVIYVNNTVKLSANENSILIGRISKDESNKKLANVWWIFIIYI